MNSEDKKKLLTDSKTFCMLPFVHMYLNTNGEVLPCCTSQYKLPLGNVREHTIKEIWNNEKYKEVRRKIINNEPIDNCKSCYMHEKSSSNNSFRKWSNEDFGKFIDVVDFMEPDGHMKEMPLRYFDVRFSNICNYKCRSCSEMFSSSWAQELKKYDDNFKRKPISIHVSNNDPALLEQFKPFLPGMQVVYFAGGEPLITPEHYEVLDHLIKSNATSTKLRYNSNMSVLGYKDKNIIDLWNKFENVELSASLDSWGERAEYIRSGTHWPTVVENLKRIKKEAPNVNIQFNCVVTLMNVLTITEFLDVLYNEGLFDYHNTWPTLYRAIDPAELSMRVLDAETKKLAKEKIESWLAKQDSQTTSTAYALNGIIAFLEEDHSHLTQKARWNIDTLDLRRNESFVKTFPELKDWYERR